MGFASMIAKALKSTGKKPKSSKRTRSNTRKSSEDMSPPPAREPTTAATSQKEIDKIKAANKRNKEMYGVGDSTPKYKQRAKRSTQAAVVTSAGAASMTAKDIEKKSKEKSEKAMSDYEAKRDAVKKKRSESSKPAAKTSAKKDMSFGEAFRAARKEGKKEFTWRGNKYHTQTKDEQISMEKFSKGGYKKAKRKMAGGGMVNGKKPRTGSMDYRKGGLFR